MTGRRLRHGLGPALCVAVLAAAVPIAAPAHDARPLSITAVEQADSVYRVVVRVPPTIEPANVPVIVWDAACELLESRRLVRATGGASLVACPGGLGGRRLRVDYPYYNPALTTLFRLEPVDGAPVTAIFPPDELEWIVPAEPTFAEVARDYLRLGFEHIWGGLDHLLFVAGLLLLARRMRRIVLAVTGFTVAHSITLSLAALGFVRVPIAPVEAMIALSILFLAAEIARNDPSSFSQRFPVVLSFVFGLLHGFGFASALAAIGLPRADLATGLLFFNLGVELGQLAFIAAVLAPVMLVVRLATPRTGSRVAFARLAMRPGTRAALAQAPIGLAGAYALGVPAAFWFIARTAAAFGGP